MRISHLLMFSKESGLLQSNLFKRVPESVEYFQLLLELVLLAPFLFLLFNPNIVNYELLKLKFCCLSEEDHSLAVDFVANSVFSHTKRPCN